MLILAHGEFIFVQIYYEKKAPILVSSNVCHNCYNILVLKSCLSINKALLLPRCSYSDFCNRLKVCLVLVYFHNSCFKSK